MGCILAELLQRKPLFQGRDYIDQLKLIIRTLGSPSEEDLAFISSSRARAYIRALQASEARAARPRCMSAALQCTHTHSFHPSHTLSLFLVLFTMYRPCTCTLSAWVCCVSCAELACGQGDARGRGRHRVPRSPQRRQSALSVRRARAAVPVLRALPGRERARDRPAGGHAAVRPAQAHHRRAGALSRR